MNILPEVLLDNIYWSFKEPVPNSPVNLVEAVSKYYLEVFKEHLDKTLLIEQSPFFKLNVTYTYSARKPTGEWQDIPMKIRIDGRGKRLSYADILWQIHKAVYENLKNRDHHYFEGLEIIQVEDENEVPLYKIWLGN